MKRSLYLPLIALFLCWLAPLLLWAQPGDSGVVNQVSPAPQPVQRPPVVYNRPAQTFPQNPAAIQAPAPAPVSTENSLADQSDVLDNPFALGEVSSNNPFALASAAEKGQKKNTKTLKVAKPKAPRQAFLSLPKNPAGGWFLFTLLTLLGFLTVLVSVYRDKIADYFKVFTNMNIAWQRYRDVSSFVNLADVLFYLLFVLNAGVLVYQVTQLYGVKINSSPLLDLLLYIGGVSLIYTLRHLKIGVLSFIYPFGNETSFYSYIISTTNRVIGILLMPFLFLIAYAPPGSRRFMVFTTIGLYASIYIYRSIRGLLIASNYIAHHKFHFFMYLCTVEIAPVVILVKLLMQGA